MRCPLSSTEPLVTSPRSVRSTPETALRVVVFPAPLAPSRVGIRPSSQEMDTPLRTRMTLSKIPQPLLRLSIATSRWRGRGAPSSASPFSAPRLLRARGLDVLGHHVGVRRIPVGHLLELAALHLPDLDQPAALVISRRDLERRHQPAEGEVGDLLEAGLHVHARDLPVRLRLEGVADGLDVDRRDEDAAVVEHRRR